MGKIKYIYEIREFFKKSPIVSINSLKRFIIKKKNKDYIYLLINKMIKKKEINKITKGYYTIYEDPSLTVFCFKPSYLGLGDALSMHNLWEQEAIPIIITTRKIRQGIRKIMGLNVLLRRMDKRYFFGFEYIKQGDFYYPYSDIEKTFIDMVYFKEHLDKEMIKEFRKRISRKKLVSYLKSYPKTIKTRVFRVLRNP